MSNQQKAFEEWHINYIKQSNGYPSAAREALKQRKDA